MDRLSKNEITMLLEKQKGSCVSIFLPTSRGGVESQKDQLRLRHQIRDAENRLLLDNLRSTEVEKLLEPLHALFADGDSGCTPLMDWRFFALQSCSAPTGSPIVFKSK
jgi:hypothetical protein